MTLWRCVNCFQVGELTEHGECASCGSIAVMPTFLPTDETRVREGQHFEPALEYFLRDYQRLTWQNPLHAYERVLGCLAAFSLRALRSQQIVRIESLRSMTRAQRFGTRALTWLCELADQHSIVLTGTIEPIGKMRPRLNVRELTAWYRRHGFTIQKRDMYRVPQ